MKAIRFIYNIIKVIVTIAIIALLAIVLTQRVSDNKMSIAGIRIFTVVTESMVPKYVVGDALLVMSVPPEELQVGDDITYQGEKDTFSDKIITHRIVKIDKQKDETYKIITKGLVNDKEDPAINESQVYGKVIYKIKSISFINGIIGNLYGMYFVIVVPMAIMVFIEIINYRKDKRDELNAAGFEQEGKELSESKIKNRRIKRQKRRERIRKKSKEE